ncbi:MAG TPA: hypothetical protein ENN09_07095, partial [Planctomycetes bacterium]|nr:hypothetical protein [Planctomycetota bacterium]
MTLNPLIPLGYVILLGVLLAVLAALSELLSARKLGAARLALLVSLRITGVTAVVLLLLNPSRVETFALHGDKPMVAFLLDASRSMATGDYGKEPAGRAVSRLDGGRKLVEYAVKAVPGAFSVRAAMFASGDGLFPFDAVLDDARTARTGIAAALLQLAAEHPSGLLAAFVVTDGIETADGDLDAAASSARLAGFPLYPVLTGGDVFPPN